MNPQISLQYYIRAMQEIRTSVGELRDTLDALERRLRSLQEEALPEILAQLDAAQAGEE